ncbi:MAG: glycosyltransferase family 4 protein [Acidimicrobiales bacterium]
MSSSVGPEAVMGFYFFPRGGSAQVARYLCRALAGSRWEPTLFTGSLGTASENSNAARFFAGTRAKSLDYSAATDRWADGEDPMSATVPLHASYEDKPGAPDRVFVDLDDAAFARQVRSWTQHFAQHTAIPSVMHLHHLTPMHEAVRALWPDAPVVTHLHGTELKMLASVVDGTLPQHPGRFSGAWVARMRRWACESDRVVVISAEGHQLAVALLGVEPARVTTIANGVDPELFAPTVRSPTERLAQWRRWLVDDPRGWYRGGAEGSIRYEEADLSAFTDEGAGPVPVVLFAGRFLRFKRLQLLIEAHHSMRLTTGHRSVLVVVGGFPGEWEGEHPYDTVRRLGDDNVFFTGWRDHDDLAEILGSGDVFAAPSVDEPFGLVYLEAMAAGLPPIATNTGGPRSFINVDPMQPTGWLVPPDDVAATAQALADAVSHPVDRAARGKRAARFVRDQYSWASSADAFANLYQEVVDESAGA